MLHFGAGRLVASRVFHVAILQCCAMHFAGCRKAAATHMLLTVYGVCDAQAGHGTAACMCVFRIAAWEADVPHGLWVVRCAAFQ